MPYLILEGENCGSSFSLRSLSEESPAIAHIEPINIKHHWQEPPHRLYEGIYDQILQILSLYWFD